MPDGGVEAAVAVGGFDSAVADVVGGAMHESAWYAAAGEPRGAALGVVVPAGGVLRPGCAFEFAGLAMESFAEVPLPETVHRHLGEQGLVGRGESVGERFDEPFPEVDGAAHEVLSEPSL